MRTCTECGKTKNVSHSRIYGVDLCPNCSQMYKNHPQHDIPPAGEVIYDDMGRPICHICGRAFDKLLTHAKQRHKIDSAEYKEKFGLEAGKGIISNKTRDILQQRVKENYDIVVVENLNNKGAATRFKSGYAGRTKDKVRLKTKIMLTNRAKSIGPGRSVK